MADFYTIPLPSLPRSARPRDLAAHARDARGSSLLLLFGLLVLIRVVRHGGQLPTRREATGYFLAAMFFVLTAAFAPDFATALVLVLLIAAAFDAAPQISAAITNIGALVNDQATSAAGRLRSGS